MQYESRRLYAEIEKAADRGAAPRDRARAAAVEKRAQATPLRVEKLAKEQLHMRPATPAITQYVTLKGTCTRRGGRAMSGRSVAYTSSPLLASKTPVWRSKFIVAAHRARLRWRSPAAPRGCRCSATTSSSKQGEVRFARTLELPANRGRILDRNGLLLATSVPAPSIWAIPEDVERDNGQARASWPKLLGMPLAGAGRRSWTTKTRPSSG